MTASTLDDDLYDLRFYLQRCVRYHMRRSAFFLKWQRITSFVGVVFGSAALTSLINQADPEWSIAFALVVTVMSAFDLVVGTGQHAWLHNDLRKRFLEQLGVLDAQQVTPALLAEVRHQIRRIEADEPADRVMVNLIATNDVIRSTFGRDEVEEHVYDIGWCKRVTANLIDWGIDKYRTKAQAKEDSESSSHSTTTVA